MATEKTVLFAFRGNPLCFIHVLLNALDLHERGMGGRIVIEGEAVTLVPEMSKPDHFLSQLYQQVKGAGLIAGACKACSTKLGVIESVEQEGISLLGDMSGHPSMGRYKEQGYQVVTF